MNHHQNLRDGEILQQLKLLVQSERDVLVKILHHLREVERRRLFSDLGCQSLFDYAVKELKYSEGQASRRIQAMRLLTELPEIETKIATGELSLSNVQQAQSLFREMRISEPMRIVDRKEKIQVLARIENKSVREAQKELLKIQPQVASPKERERVVNETASEIKFLMTDQLRQKLEEVRSLVGTKGAYMTYAELIEVMSDLSVDALKARRFGKKRVEQESQTNAVMKKSATLATKVPAANKRYIPRVMKHSVWQRDGGKCTGCGTRKHLNYDHIKPVALGGSSSVDNLRLLCFQCNQRASTKTFGRVYVNKTDRSSRTLSL